ncbi:hypothetical protein [Pediococcus stilesii]|uniref:hypothetical protein n=1 Tax=Pediococcus stilesii TaxID=331679 RepID=UPI001BB26171|nr:hypothetical protein [Pediococcus stilesii]
MELLDRIDKNATLDEMENLLSQYRKNKSYMNAPNPRITASYGNSGAASTAPQAEYAEDYTIKAQQGEQFCNWIDWAVDSCSRYKYREILKIIYCEGYELDNNLKYLDKLSMRLDYDVSSSSFFRWRDTAKLQVAETIGMQMFINPLGGKPVNRRELEQIKLQRNF